MQLRYDYICIAIEIALINTRYTCIRIEINLVFHSHSIG